MAKGEEYNNNCSNKKISAHAFQIRFIGNIKIAKTK